MRILIDYAQNTFLCVMVTFNTDRYVLGTEIHSIQSRASSVPPSMYNPHRPPDKLCQEIYFCGHLSCHLHHVINDPEISQSSIEIVVFLSQYHFIIPFIPLYS